jgi:hypothetical protein
VNTKLDATGKKLTEVLEQSWAGGFSIQSDFARTHAPYVALAASEGFITTIISKERFGRIWRLTPEGSKKLYENRLYFSLKESTHDAD